MKRMQTITCRNHDCKGWWLMKTFKQFTEKPPNTADAMKKDTKQEKQDLQIKHI